MDLINVFLTVVLCSIPEEFFITVLTLILLGRYDYLVKEDWRRNLCKIMIISVIPIALIFAFLKFWLNNIDYMLVVNIVIFSISISILAGVKGVKDYFKIVLTTSLATLIFMITQIFTAFVAIYGLNVELKLINEKPILSFVVTIPERLIQYLSLFMIFLRQNSLTKVNIHKLIFENKSLRNITIIFTFIDILLLILIVKFIFFEKMLKNLCMNYQIFISITLISLVIINVLSIWIFATCIYPVEKYKQKYRI